MTGLSNETAFRDNAVEYGIVPNPQGEFGRGLLIMMPLFAAMVAAAF